VICCFDCRVGVFAIVVGRDLSSMGVEVSCLATLLCH
jgi:hypothetical protein